MAENIASVRLEIKDRKTFAAVKEAVESVEGFRILNSHGPLGTNNNLFCDLLIMEICEDAARECQLVRSIQDAGIADEVFLTSARAEPEILLGALRTGAKEFFTQPVKRDEVVTSLLKFRERRANAETAGLKERKGKIVTVIGSKGGVGTTTVAVNLASGFARVNGTRRVSLVDMNPLFGEIPLFLDMQSSFNWGEAARDISRLDSTYLMSVISKHPSGIYVLPSPAGLDSMHLATPDNVELLVKQMQNTFNFVVIDGGNTLNEISLKVMELSDVVFIVSVLTVPCLVNIKKILDICRKVGYGDERNIQVIVNRHEKRSLISLDEAEKTLDRKIYWVIPNDYENTMVAINQGKTLESIAGNTSVTKNFRQLASTLFHKRTKEKEKGSIFETLFGRKEPRTGQL